MIFSKRILLWVSCLILLALPAFSQSSPQQKPDYLNPDLPIDRRVDDLVGRMTLEEKASQLVHGASPIDGLGVPAYNWWSEGLHGVGFAGVATVFPQAIGLAATWDTGLLHEVATAIGTEARAKHHQAVREGRRELFYGLTIWSPNINIFRDPRWGRGQETYGEDPFLTSRMGVAFVTGVQGNDPRYLRVVSTPKHFAVHSGPESTRHIFDVGISRHDMADTYLPAFRATVIEGKAGSVMCAYNAVNGQPACANDYLLRNQLRNSWRFDGYVVSDCGAVNDIWDGHNYASSPEQAAAFAIKTGMDLECGEGYEKYVRAVQQGFIAEADLTTAVKRLYRARFRLGMFDPPEKVEYARTPFSENDSEAHRQLSLQAARESMVLLKNNGVLPLATTVKRIAVVGPLANSVSALLGNYNGTASRATTALAGIRRQFANAEVIYQPGARLADQPLPVSPEVFSGGVKAEFFKNTNLQGAPAFTRVEPNIEEPLWHEPQPGFGTKDFSIRWTAHLIPDASGTYQLGFAGDGGVRVYLDNKLVVEDWTLHGPKALVAPVQLQRGHDYSLRVEYFQTQGGATARLVWMPGTAGGSSMVTDAIAAAQKSDAVIAVVGITAALEGEESDINIPGFKGGDRTSLDLPKEEEYLLQALKTTGKPLIVVLMNGSALAVNWAQQNADAILESWYPGEEGGAIAETLAGANNPAGRLPVTFYKSVDQLPPFDDYSMKNRTYRYFKGEPLYPFGYGLSYTRFEYSKLRVDTRLAGGAARVDAQVTNVGDREGDEVAEAYISRLHSQYIVPIRALAGFLRFHLKPGETRDLSFVLSHDQLSAINQDGDYVFEPGKFTVSVGGAQPSEAGLRSQEVVQSSFAMDSKP